MNFRHLSAGALHFALVFSVMWIAFVLGMKLITVMLALLFVATIVLNALSINKGSDEISEILKNP